MTAAVTPAPTVTGFAPTSGPVGTAVTLTGTGFTGATAVALQRHRGDELRGGLRHADHGHRAGRRHDAARSPSPRPAAPATSATSFTVTLHPDERERHQAPRAVGSYRADQRRGLTGRPGRGLRRASSASGRVSPAAAGTSASSCAADGTQPTATSVTLDVPVGTGYRDRRRLPRPRWAAATWSGFGPEPGSLRGRGSGLQHHHRHRPRRRAARQARAASLPVTWTTNAAVRRREFAVWVAQPRQRLVRGQARAQPTARASYVDQRHPRRAGRHRLPRRRRLPRHGRQRRLEHLRPEPGHVRRDGARSSTPSPSPPPPAGRAARPRAAACRSPGRPTRRYRRREFAVWVRQPAAAGTSASSCRSDGTRVYATQRHPRRAGRHRLPHRRRLPRPRSAAAPGAASRTSPGPFAVTSASRS